MREECIMCNVHPSYRFNSIEFQGQLQHVPEVLLGKLRTKRCTVIPLRYGALTLTLCDTSARKYTFDPLILLSKWQVNYYLIVLCFALFSILFGQLIKKNVCICDTLFSVHIARMQIYKYILWNLARTQVLSDDQIYDFMTYVARLTYVILHTYDLI